MSTDLTLTPSTVASQPADGTFAADIAAANAAGLSSVSAATAANQQDRDAAVWRAANGWA